MTAEQSLAAQRLRNTGVFNGTISKVNQSILYKSDRSATLTKTNNNAAIATVYFTMCHHCHRISMSDCAAVAAEIEQRP